MLKYIVAVFSNGFDLLLYFPPKKRGPIMQKTFIKYTAGIVTIAVLLILFINFIFSFHMLETQQFETFYAKTEQMIHTLKNNQEEPFKRELKRGLPYPCQGGRLRDGPAPGRCHERCTDAISRRPAQRG